MSIINPKERLMVTYVREMELTPRIVKQLEQNGVETVQFLVKVLREDADVFSKLKGRIGLADMDAALLLERLVGSGELNEGTLQTIPDYLRSTHTSSIRSKEKRVATLRRKLRPIQNRISGRNGPLGNDEYRSLRAQERRIVKQLMNLGAW
ncbi:hypothetical protein KBC70_03200 [Candidatus Woesebacteria bacterium]|nr:hypothetical protein [Candidatus Woesebacteria bacterium]